MRWIIFLREAGIGPEQVDYVVFYDKPLLKFDRLLETYVAYAPKGLRSFMLAIPQWLKTKLHLPKEIKKGAGRGLQKARHFHSSSREPRGVRVFSSPFEEAAILTLDGVGEWDTASIGHGCGNKIEMLKTLHFPHSLGLLFSAFTYCWLLAVLLTRPILSKGPTAIPIDKQYNEIQKIRAGPFEE